MRKVETLMRRRRGLKGAEVRWLRLKTDLTQADLARLLGVKELTVDRWERDQVPIPVSADVLLRKMAGEDHALKFSLWQVIGWRTGSPPFHANR